jgi:hypothetical protein
VEPGLTPDEVLIAPESDPALGNDSIEFGKAWKGSSAQVARSKLKNAPIR